MGSVSRQQFGFQALAFAGFIGRDENIDDQCRPHNDEGNRAVFRFVAAPTQPFENTINHLKRRQQQKAADCQGSNGFITPMSIGMIGIWRAFREAVSHQRYNIGNRVNQRIEAVSGDG
jgi:hypothetical protein